MLNIADGLLASAGLYELAVIWPLNDAALAKRSYVELLRNRIK